MVYVCQSEEEPWNRWKWLKLSYLLPNVWLKVPLQVSRKSSTKSCAIQPDNAWLFVTWKTLTQCWNSHMGDSTCICTCSNHVRLWKTKCCDASLSIIRALKIEVGVDVTFSWPWSAYWAIMLMWSNPRVSRRQPLLLRRWVTDCQIGCQDCRWFDPGWGHRTLKPGSTLCYVWTSPWLRRC